MSETAHENYHNDDHFTVQGAFTGQQPHHNNEQLINEEELVIVNKESVINSNGEHVGEQQQQQQQQNGGESSTNTNHDQQNNNEEAVVVENGGVSLESENTGDYNRAETATTTSNTATMSSVEASPSSTTDSGKDETASSYVAPTSSNANNESQDPYSYDTVFPSLPNAAGVNLTAMSAWNHPNKLSIRQRHQNTTVVFHVPVEERRYKDSNNGTSNSNAFGGNETNKKCVEIASKHGVKVEVCTGKKDQGLHIVITGPEDKCLEAKRLIVSELQTSRGQQIHVPKDQHKYIIGPKGATLKELQEKTCTSIQVPKSELNSDTITITGPKDGIEQAIHEIHLIIEKQLNTGFERLDIPKLYHPWIRGFNNEIANDIAARTGAKVNIPPPAVENNEIAVSGEREKVDQACAEIKRIYDQKKRLNITRLSVQITKSQHKLIIGRSGSSVQEIFRDYDVYVQVPRLDDESETIFLYGEESKLSAALAQVVAKVNSVVNIKIEAPSWMHRHLIGEKGANISKITADYPNTHVKFEADNRITVDGPPDEVEKVRQRLEAIIMAIKTNLVCEEITVDPKYYPQLVGKKYDNISRLNKEFSVLIRVPSVQDGASVSTLIGQPVRIEGAPEAVQRAKEEFLEMVKKLENERSKDIIIEQRYHSNLIGKNGKNLIEIRAKFNDIQINIPSQEEKSDVVTIRGNKLDVEKCYKHLQQYIKDLSESNYQEELHIFKQFHRMLIGKQGAFIRKIREDTNTRIEVPNEGSDSDSIVIVGKQENVIKAKKMIEEKVKELLKIEEDFVDVPHQLHNSLIGRGGAVIKQIRQECGGVIINFPPEATEKTPGSDRITLKGPRDEIERAKQELLKAAKLRNEASHVEEVAAKFEYHKFLVGHKGANVNSVREKYDVRIIFPSSKDNNNNKATSNGSSANNMDVITIIGREESVKAARQELEASIKQLEEQVIEEIHVDAKWHKNFIAKRAKLVTKISEENCNVKISFPKQGEVSDVVTLKGPRDAVDSAKKRIGELVYEFENQVTEELIVPSQYHASLIGKKGINSQQISDDFRVDIQIPAKPSGDAVNEHENGHENGDGLATAASAKPDSIFITGFRDDVEKAKQALLALVPMTEEFSFPQKFHKHLLENKADALKNLGNTYNVQIKVPKRETSDADYVSIVGTRENIDQAKEALAEKLKEFELRNFSVEIENVKDDLIPQLRGRNGAEVTKLEAKFNVRIEFSRKEEPNKITIRGLEENVHACETHIRKRIEDDEAKVAQEIEIDNRVHSRIIGQKGNTLKKIMEKFKVEVKFSSRSSDLVQVKGSSTESVEDACDYLKNLEEEYLQDVTERDAYTHPSSKSNEDTSARQPKEFVVRGAPWEQSRSNGQRNPNEPPPDTSNIDDFPTISTVAASGPAKASWGPSRR